MNRQRSQSPQVAYSTSMADLSQAASNTGWPPAANKPMMSQQQFETPQQSQPSQQQQQPLVVLPADMSSHLSVRKTAGVVILLGSLIMIFLAISIFIYLMVASKSAPLFAIIECLYFIIQSCIGIYAATFRSQQALVVYVILCIFNSVLLTTVLLVDSSNQLIMGDPTRSLEQVQQWPESCNQLQALTMSTTSSNADKFEKVIADCWAAIMKQEEICDRRVRRLHGLAPTTCCLGYDIPCKMRLLSLRWTIMNVTAGSAAPNTSDDEVILTRLDDLMKQLKLPSTLPPPSSQPSQPPPMDEHTGKPMIYTEILARVVLWHLAFYNIFIAIVAGCLIAFDTDEPHHRAASQSRSVPRPNTYLQTYSRNNSQLQQQQLDLMRAPQFNTQLLTPPSSTVSIDQQKSIQSQQQQQSYLDYNLRQQPTPSAAAQPLPSTGQPVEQLLQSRALQSPTKLARSPRSPRSPLRLTKTPRSPSARKQRKQFAPRSIKSDRIC